MSSDNRAYSQFDDSGTPAAHYGTTPSTGGQIISNEEKVLKTWKNSRRLCWVLLILGIITLVLEIIGAGLSGAYLGLEELMARFIAGVWLAVLGVVAAALGLRAFKSSYESSKCWTMSHFVMLILASVAYIVLFLIAIFDIIGTREVFYSLDEEDYLPPLPVEDEVPQNTTESANATTILTTTMATTAPLTIDDIFPTLRALKGEMTISIFLLGTTIAFCVVSIIANIIICRHTWFKGGSKTMTIVYMPQDASGNAQTQQVVVPSKTQVVVVPGPKTDQNPNKFP